MTLDEHTFDYFARLLTVPQTPSVAFPRMTDDNRFTRKERDAYPPPVCPACKGRMHQYWLDAPTFGELDDPRYVQGERVCPACRLVEHPPDA